ncbi:ribbon-helix-helix protein, CopG family [Citricoccus sp. CH26A]|uniref:ribbon-helix-helix protein, CopG family n=1 Tax=Citricoccus sp. CH26A TaxID=1045009 RepID=UPI0002ED58B3
MLSGGFRSRTMRAGLRRLTSRKPNPHRSAEEIAALDEVAGREHLSRSEAIRRALTDFAA